MALAVDDYAAGDRVELDMVRGERFRLRFALYEDVNEGAACAPAVAGDPKALTSYSGLVAVGRVNGTNARLLVTATLIDPGAVNRAAVVSLAVEAADLEACFAEGAEQAFDITVLAHAPGRSDLILAAHVEVEDSAFGATR